MQLQSQQKYSMKTNHEARNEDAHFGLRDKRLYAIEKNYLGFMCATKKNHIFHFCVAKTRRERNHKICMYDIVFLEHDV